jgi:predicted nucleic acid-binding protein
MRKNVNAKIIVVLVVVVIVALTFTQMYHVREDTAGELLWKDDRAYLFMSSARRSLALRVGQIDGDNQAKDIRLPLSDLLIGVTALELGYSVATSNLRHFQMIPGLSVVQC